MTVKIPVRLQPVRVRRENDIQREVLEALRRMGKFCLRLQSGKVKVKGGWMQLCPEGTPDILLLEPVIYPAHGSGVIAFNRVTWIEMKTSAGKQNPEQIEFERNAICRAERYVTARSLDDVLKVLK